MPQIQSAEHIFAFHIEFVHSFTKRVYTIFACFLGFTLSSNLSDWLCIIYRKLCSMLRSFLKLLLPWIAKIVLGILDFIVAIVTLYCIVCLVSFFFFLSFFCFCFIFPWSPFLHIHPHSFGFYLDSVFYSFPSWKINFCTRVLWIHSYWIIYTQIILWTTLKSTLNASEIFFMLFQKH